MHQMQNDRSGGTLDVMAAQVQAGMTQHEAVRRILACDHSNVDAVYVHGTMIDNEPFSGLGFRALEKLPPASQTKQTVIEVNDEQGRELVVTFVSGVVARITLRRS
jgi:hypothetical protein